ncbi:DNA polymerase IV, partial [Streptomyces sp. NPDC004726]
RWRRASIDQGTAAGARPAGSLGERRWPAGHDVRHAVYGAGWVQGSGVGRVTVRFEEPDSPPGRVRTFRTDDPELVLSDPLPLVALVALADDSRQASSPATFPKERSRAGDGGVSGATESSRP